MKRIVYHPVIIRLLHWEYWSSKLVYAPLVPYWLWLSLRARSFYFLTAANPGIANGGFINESKKDVYDLLPPGSYPETLYFRNGTAAQQVMQGVAERGLQFPLILKPDVGERGMAVKKVSNEAELERYVDSVPIPFLVQEFVPHSYEAGIFWVRMPGEQKGRITGIVNKEPVTVTGDGGTSVAELVHANKRYVLQREQIAVLNADKMDSIPAVGERVMLVPYGNHCRGSLFTDHTFRASQQLNDRMNEICCGIPGFYYGRLDVMFRDWQALEAGRDFSIVELNGSGSEPTHIYDPGKSIFSAWKEIIKHWNILFRIARENNRRGVAYLTLAQGRREQHAFRQVTSLLGSRTW